MPTFDGSRRHVPVSGNEESRFSVDFLLLEAALILQNVLFFSRRELA